MTFGVTQTSVSFMLLYVKLLLKFVYYDNFFYFYFILWYKADF